MKYKGGSKNDFFCNLLCLPAFLQRVFCADFKNDEQILPSLVVSSHHVGHKFKKIEKNQISTHCDRFEMPMMGAQKKWLRQKFCI